MSDERELTPLQEVQRMEWAVRHVKRISPAGRKWLVSWMLAKWPDLHPTARRELDRALLTAAVKGDNHPGLSEGSNEP